MGDRPVGGPRTPRRRFLGFLRHYGTIFALLQAILVVLYWRLSHQDFVALVRDLGTWAILVVFVYKEIIFGVMAITYSKDRLDRCFIWQIQAIAGVALFAWWANYHPDFYLRHFLAMSVLWAELWFQMLWSCIETIQALWVQRLQYVYLYFRTNGFRLTVRNMRQVMARRV